MHARLTTANVQPDRFDEAVVAVKETFQPAAREQSGFRGFLAVWSRSRCSTGASRRGHTQSGMAAIVSIARQLAACFS